MCRHGEHSSLRSSGGCVPATWRACDSWRVLSGQHPKLRERILAILFPVERPNASIPDRSIAREDLRLIRPHDLATT